MGRGSSGAGGGGIQESNMKPKGGGGSGNGQEPITVQPFRLNPDDLPDALGPQKRPIGVMNALSGANPFYSGGAQGDFTQNCQRAVIAYEARRRGYDVIAQPTFPGDKLPLGGEWMKAFQNPQEIHVGTSSPTKTQANLEAQMKSFGNGSRGIVRIPGHVFNVENVNGKIRYVDAQTNTVYNSKNVFSRIGRGTSSISLIRTDNLKFSDNAKKSVTPSNDLVKTIVKRKGLR